MSTMTAAEFKARTEMMGYSPEMVGVHLDVSDRTVRRWASGTSKRIPDEALEWVAEEWAEFWRMIHDLEDAPNDGPVVVPRPSDEGEDGRPSGFHRAVATLAGRTLVYAGGA